MPEMPDRTKISWDNIDVEFDTATFAEAEIEAAVRAVETRLPGFGNRVPPGSMIVLSRHGYSGEYVGAYQVGVGRPHEIARKARSARKAAGVLLAEIASRITADISTLRPI